MVTDGKEETAPAEQSVSPEDAVQRHVVPALAFVFAVFAISEVNLLWLQPFQQRAVFLSLPLALAFLIPKRGALHPRTLPWKTLDYLFAVLCLKVTSSQKIWVHFLFSPFVPHRLRLLSRLRYKA